MRILWQVVETQNLMDYLEKEAEQVQAMDLLRAADGVPYTSVEEVGLRPSRWPCQRPYIICGGKPRGSSSG